MYGEIKVAVFVNGVFYQHVLHNPRKHGNFVTIRVTTPLPPVNECNESMRCYMKEFRAYIKRMEGDKAQAHFKTCELYWEDNTLLYKPIAGAA